MKLFSRPWLIEKWCFVFGHLWKEAHPKLRFCRVCGRHERYLGLQARLRDGYHPYLYHPIQIRSFVEQWEEVVEITEPVEVTDGKA